MRKRGTRAGAISVYCTKEALIDSGIDFDSTDRARVGVYLGITEHGNVETENEIQTKMETRRSSAMLASAVPQVQKKTAFE